MENLIEFDKQAGPSDRNFGLTFAFVISAFTLFGAYKYAFSLTTIYTSLSLAGLFLLISVLKPSLLSILNTYWTKLGTLLHKIITPLIMMLVYATVFIPIGLIMKLSGKNVMVLYKDGASSFWINKTKSELPEPMKYQF